MKTLLTLFAVLLAAPLTARAQSLNVATLEAGSDVATLTTGTEHGLMLGLGYARAVTVADRAVAFHADVALGWAEVDVDDFALRTGALAPIVGEGRWKVLGGLAAVIRGTENDIARMFGAGVDAAILAGRYARGGFFAAELGFDWTLTTHVGHRDLYRTKVYADARDGWYGNPAGMFRVGLQGGLSFGRYDVVVRAGRFADVAGKPPLFPFYGTLSFYARW